jgi:2-oxoisovalerate dehydrogenase E2 component (dihydrolipoyl transacylase)
MAVQTFRLPDPGEGLVEADIVTWRVAVGDKININDILLEVETSKSVVELPSPFAGTVTALLVNEGETVEVGAPIITINDDVAVNCAAGEGPAGDGADIAAGEAPVEPPRVPNLVGYGARTTQAKRRPRKPAASDADAGEAHDRVAAAFSTGAPVSRRADQREALTPSLPKGSSTSERSGPPLPQPGPASKEPVLTGAGSLAKPPVRKLAKDLGVDLGTVAGTGIGGVITREDVERAAGGETEPALGQGPAISAAEAAPRPPTEPGATESRIPIKGVRKATAQAMVESAFTAPHVSVSTTCDVSSTMELVDRLRQRREFRDIKVSPLLIVAKAVLLALGRNPELNSAWDEPAGEVVIKHSVNLGIAAATPRGLIVPNIKGAESLTLDQLAESINSVVATARDGKTQPAEMAGGTFTITNIGIFGIDAGTPILNPGESGILCIGQIARRPWVVGAGEDERIEPRWLATLTLSFDHRLADGEQGSIFLADVAGILSDPGLGLLY